MKITAIILAGLLLSGCAGNIVTKAITSDDPDEISFVRKDLEAALASAKANDDQLGEMCWAAIIKKIEEPRTKTNVVGALSAYQKARNVRRKLEGGLDTSLRIGCAPMLTESRKVIFSKLRKLAPGL